MYLSTARKIPICFPAEKRSIEGGNFGLQIVALVRPSLDHKDGLTVILGKAVSKNQSGSATTGYHKIIRAKNHIVKGVR